MKSKHVNLIASLGISTAVCLIIIFLSDLRGWPLVIVTFLVIMGGQAFRYFLDHSSWFKPSLGDKPITKKELETEVRTYFDNHPGIAKKFLRMDELAKKGNFHDAISLGNALKKERLSPIVNKYVNYKLDSYKKFRRN